MTTRGGAENMEPKMKETLLQGYTLYVESAYSNVNWKRAQELKNAFREKYGLEINFPIESTVTRHRFDISKIDIPRNLNILDGLLQVLEENKYNVKRFSRKIL
jgi:hypothetical protein